MEESYRRGSNIGEAGEEGVEMLPSEDGDLVIQLREKVRTQAQRLRMLEQYRVLCEERIQDLSPSHPLPVKPEHLGKRVDGKNELHMAKQKIARLEQQLSKQQVTVPLADSYVFPHPSTQLTLSQLQELYNCIYFQLHKELQDKTSLEESLRSEMLNNEEQRSYIEVLKQALETKMDELGFYNKSVDDFIEMTGQKAQGDAHKRDLSKMNAVIGELENQLETKNQECEILMQERETTDQHLQEAAEALQYAEEEVKRLEEEKSSLIDYIEPLNRREEEFAKEKENLENKINELNEIVSENEERLAIQDEVESDLKRYKTELSKYQNLLRESEQNLNQLNSKVSNSHSEIADTKQQMQHYRSMNENLQANTTALSNTLLETQNELDHIRKAYENSKSQIHELQKALEKTENQISNVTMNKVKVESKVQELEEQILYMEKDHREQRDRLKEKNHEEIRQSHQQINYLQDEINRTSQAFQNSLKKESELQQEIISYKTLLEKLENKREKLKKHKAELQENLKNTHSEKDNAKYEIDNMMSIKERLEIDLEKAMREIEKEKSLCMRVQQEKDNLDLKLREANRNIRESTEQALVKERSLEKAIDELESLKRALAEAKADIYKKETLYTDTFNDFSVLKQESQKLEQKLEVYARQNTSVENCVDIIKNFCHNFGAVSTSSSTYEAVISSAFKESISKWTYNEGNIEEWLQVTSEELEALIRRLADMKDMLEANSQKLRYTQEKLESLSFDESALRDRERSLKLKVSTLEEEKAKAYAELESYIDRMHSLQTDSNSLKKDYLGTLEENSRLKDQLKLTTSETVQWKHTAETDIFTIKSIEEKANLLLKEKKELENLVNKMQSSVPSAEMQKLFLEMMRTRAEIEVIERERIRIENSLLRSEADMRTLTRSNKHQEAIQIRREVESLRTQLANCDSQVQSYKRRMNGLDEELKEIECIERRRYALHL